MAFPSYETSHLMQPRTMSAAADPPTLEDADPGPHPGTLRKAGDPGCSTVEAERPATPEVADPDNPLNAPPARRKSMVGMPRDGMWRNRY